MVTLYDHQVRALERLSNGKILCGDVGTGKSLTALAYYVQNASPKPLYVITTAKKRDSLEWDGDGVKLSISSHEGVGAHGKMTVDSWNNIGKYVGIEDAFFIFDEQRLVGTGAWVKSFLKIAKKNQWILLSATPGDTWMDYMAVFIANGFYKNQTEFKRRHVVYSSFTKYPKIERYLETGVLIRQRSSLLVTMDYQRHTSRHVIYQDSQHDAGLLDMVLKKRWNIFEDRPCKDVAELMSVARKVVNSDASKQRMVREIFEKHPRLIIFYNFDYELELLRELSDLAPIAEWNGHKHEKVPESESWLYLVQYTAGAEGWNCIATNAMVFYSQTYSYRTFSQSQGRIDRLNTPFTALYYYVLRSRSAIDSAIFMAMLKKKSFNEKAFAAALEINF